MKKTAFITIDLDIASNDNINLLVEELKNDIICLHYQVYEDTSHNATFESNKETIKEIIEDFYTVINNLSAASKQMWNQCFKRSFSFGFNSGLEPYSFHSYLSYELISKITELKGSVEITIYQVPND